MAGKLLNACAGRAEELLGYGELVIGTGAASMRSPIADLAGPSVIGPGSRPIT